MALTKEHLQQVLEFIREHRSTEGGFTPIHSKLEEELSTAEPGSEYYTTLQETKEKHLEAYTTARGQGGSAWPEYENFVAEFEKGITAALKEEAA